MKFSADLSAGKGLLWLKAPRPQEDGTLVSAKRFGPETEAVPARHFDIFSHVVYGHSADRFATVDGRGDIYVFHLRANRFSLVYRADQEVTAMAFCCGKDNDMLVACADRTIRIIKSDSGATVAKLKSHRACITSLAPHPMERYAVSCGADHTMLWDLETLRRVRNVGGSGGGRSVNVQAAFLHSGNTLITLSKVDGISLYHFPTLDLRAKLMPDPIESISLRCFAITANRMHLVAATSGKTAYVWHLPSETMIEEISLPAPVSVVGGLQPMLPYSFTKSPEGSEVCMLGEDGIIRVLQVPLGRASVVLGSSCYNFAVHMDRVVTATTDGSLNLVDLAFLRKVQSRPDQQAIQAIIKADVALHERKVIKPLHSAESESNKYANVMPSDQDGIQANTAIHSLARPSLGTINESSAVSQMEKSHRRGPENARKGKKARQRGNNISVCSMYSSEGGPAQADISPADSRWLQRTERLRAYLDVHGAFTEEHRRNVWTHLLGLPRNEVAYSALTALEEMPLATDQLEHVALADSRIKMRLSRVVHALCHWCEALACGEFLPSFVLPWVRFFGRDEHAAIEACIMLILNWASPWFEYWPAPPLHVLGVVERLTFLYDPALVKHLVQMGASTKDYAWPVLQSMFSEVLDPKLWLQLMDHVLVNPPQYTVYLLAAFVVHMRGALMSLHDRKQLSYFVSRVHPVDLKSLLSTATKIQELARIEQVSEQFGLPAPSDTPPTLRFLGTSEVSFSYPLLTSFQRTAVDHHLSQYLQIREEEEQYLRRKKMAAELEEQSRRMLQQEKANNEQAELVEQARQEQRRQLELLAAERREKLRALDERAKCARLEQIQRIESQGAEQSRAIAEKQKAAIQELDRQLSSRFEEEEEWMHARLEAEKLQDIELATVNKLHRALQERQQEAQALAVQTEIDARTKMLDLKQRTKEHRWMIEDQQRQMETQMNIAEAEREAIITEEAKARMALEVRMHLEEERQKQKLAVIEAQRQARALAEEITQRQVQRHKEQHKVDEVLAAEELRHMDSIARRREAEMRGRMQEGERIIRDERLRIEKLKETRQQRLRVLEARQRMENFERQLAEQQGAWKVAAVEHERQVHQVLLDLESERKQIADFDEEIAVREDELRKKMDALALQRGEHDRFLQGERLKAQIALQVEGPPESRVSELGGDDEAYKGLLKPGERGYWQMRAALAGIHVRSKASDAATEGRRQEYVGGGHPQSGAWSIRRVGTDGDSLTDWSSVTGSDVLDEQPWVKKDIAKAKEIVMSRTQGMLSAAGAAAKSRAFEYMVSVTEDSAQANASDSSAGAAVSSARRVSNVGKQSS